MLWERKNYNNFIYIPDISALSYQTVVVRAGNSVNLSCPGTSELSLVSTLEWRCIGCSSSNNNLTSSSPPPPSSSSGGRMTSNNGVNSGGSDSSGGTSSVKLVEYAGNGAVVVWTNRERMSLDPLNYALQFFPVKNTDQGEYTCLVNERRRPEAIVHLIVQGKIKLKILRKDSGCMSIIDFFSPFFCVCVRVRTPC